MCGGVNIKPTKEAEVPLGVSFAPHVNRDRADNGCTGLSARLSVNE